MSEVEKTSVRITAKHLLPDICISCGLFTGRRAKVRHTEKFYVMDDESSTREVLGCLSFLLGPFGLVLWAIASFGGGEKPAKKMIKMTAKIRIPYCEMCSYQSPVTIAAVDVHAKSFKFDVHPRFAEELSELNGAVG